MKFRLIVLILTILIYSCAETNHKIVKVSINENISIADTTGRTGVTTNNKIDASLDVYMLKASIGYKF